MKLPLWEFRSYACVVAVRPLEMAFVDATDASAHVRALQASGVALEDVARQTGVSLATVRTLYRGCRWTTRAAAAQLVAFEPTETVDVPPALVDQLRAARADGFSVVRLAVLAKLSPSVVDEILNGAPRAKAPILRALQATVAGLPVKPVPAPVPPTPLQLVPVGRGPHAKVMTLVDAGVSRNALAEASGLDPRLIARICEVGPACPVRQSVKVRLATLSADPAAYQREPAPVPPKVVEELTHTAAEALAVLVRLRAHFSDRHLRQELASLDIPAKGVGERYWRKLVQLEQLLPRQRVAVPQLVLTDPSSWQEHAACAAPEVDLNWFFSYNQMKIAKAKAVCWHSCPVREACEQAALDNREDFGIWGGFTAWDELRRKRGLKPLRQRP